MPQASVHPLFARAIDGHTRILREGVLPPVTGETIHSALEGGVSLFVALNPRGLITRAAHHNAPDAASRAVLDVFSELLVGLPIQEAAEHGALRLVYRMREEGQPSPVSGILSPRNVGGPFTLAESLIRTVFAEHRAGSSERALNAYVPPVSPQWKALTDEERLAVVEEFLIAFRRAADLTPEDLAAKQIDRQVRVSFAMSEKIAPTQKSVLLRRLERSLRRELGEGLEAYMDEMRDQNKLRRLVTKESTERSA